MLKSHVILRYFVVERGDFILSRLIYVPHITLLNSLWPIIKDGIFLLNELLLICCTSRWGVWFTKETFQFLLSFLSHHPLDKLHSFSLHSPPNPSIPHLRVLDYRFILHSHHSTTEICLCDPTANHTALKIQLFPFATLTPSLLHSWVCILPALRKLFVGG